MAVGDWNFPGIVTGPDDAWTAPAELPRGYVRYVADLDKCFEEASGFPRLLPVESKLKPTVTAKELWDRAGEARMAQASTEKADRLEAAQAKLSHHMNELKRLMAMSARRLIAAPELAAPLSASDRALHRAIGFGMPRDSNRLGVAQYLGADE